MDYKPRHPDEPALHAELRDALNEGLTNPNFFVWIDVQPSGSAKHFDDLDHLVKETDAWLKTRDPDAVSGSDLPKLSISDRAARLEISAVPKKPEARGRRAEQIVGNPVPILTGWE